MSALKLIYEKLMEGEVFGSIDEHRLGGTTFWIVLSANDVYIHWNHFGSSSKKTSMKNLEWILTTIFETTPEEFLFDYTTYSEWWRINKCYKS